ncbi:MAG: hypothetical protein IKV86_08060 [Clostridia bacterium]|nr:hypothetical protein [Clostridia bacterium]
MKKIFNKVSVLLLIFCMISSVVSAASYDMATDTECFKITEIANPSNVYVDGALVAENVTSIPKSAITLGTHNVKIVEGETVVYDENVDVVNSVYGESTYYDFSDYTTGTYTVDGFKVFTEGAAGYASSVTVDDAHGTSFGVVYRNSASSSSWAQNYLLSSIPNEATNGLHYEFEVFSTEQKKDRNMYFNTTVDGKSKNINMLNFLGSAKSIRIYNNDKKLEDITRDDSGVWYKIVIDVVVNSNGGGTYNLGIYKEGADGFELVKSYEDLTLPATVTALNAFRFIGPYDTDSTDSYFAIDNINYSYMYKTPVISTVNGGGFDSVEFGTKNISLKLTGALDAEMFTKDNVTVGDMEIIDATVKDDVVDITLAEKLDSNKEYTITFSADTMCGFGGVLGYPLTCNITTLKDVIEVSDIAYADGKLTAKAENTTDVEKNIQVVVSYFDDDMLIKTTALDYTALLDDDSFETEITLPDGCTDINVTFMEGYVMPKVFESAFLTME